MNRRVLRRDRRSARDAGVAARPFGSRSDPEYLENCRRLGCLPRWVLIDAYQPGRYGGTGAICDWTVVQQYPSALWHPPLVLAGGLTAENVGEAIHWSAPRLLTRPAELNLPRERRTLDWFANLSRMPRAFESLPLGILPGSQARLGAPSLWFPNSASQLRFLVPKLQLGNL